MTTVGGQILTVTEETSSVPKRCELRPGVIRIHEDRIASIDWGQPSDCVDVGGPDALITPGFVDTHLHLPQFDAIGAHGLPLLPWLEQVIFPAELRWNDLGFAQAMISRVIEQCLSVGTLAIAAYATSDHQAALAALDQFSRTGFSGVVGQVMMDRAAPQALLRPPQQFHDEVERTLELFPATGSMAAAVTPRFAIACSEALLSAAGSIAKRHQSVLQTHLAETIPECEEVERRFGCRYVDVYDRFGLLTQRSLLGHGIHLDETDRRKLFNAGSTIVHCPTANSFLRSGAMDFVALREAAIPVSLGSDIGAGYERSMVRVGRAAIETASQVSVASATASSQSAQFPTPAQMWYQITAGNADALGLERCGRIQPDCAADLLIIRPDTPWRQAIDPLSHLMYSWDDRWIRNIYLRGRSVFETPRSRSTT